MFVIGLLAAIMLYLAATAYENGNANRRKREMDEIRRINEQQRKYYSQYVVDENELREFAAEFPMNSQEYIDMKKKIVSECGEDGMEPITQFIVYTALLIERRGKIPIEYVGGIDCTGGKKEAADREWRVLRWVSNFMIENGFPFGLKYVPCNKTTKQGVPIDNPPELRGYYIASNAVSQCTWQHRMI